MKETVEINGKYYKKKKIFMWQVRISEEMKSTLPRVDKLRNKYSFYRKFKRFDSPIKMNKHYILVDGYITYLLARMLGIRRIEVLIES